MKDFNEIIRELGCKLPFCFQSDDGKIYWYKGVTELLKELYSYYYLTDGAIMKGDTND